MDEDKNLQPVQPDEPTESTEPTEPELDENGNPIVDMTDTDAADVAPTAGETIKLKTDHSKTLELKTVEDVMEYSYLRYSMSVIIDRALRTPWSAMVGVLIVVSSNPLVSSATSWVNITRTAIAPFTTLWCVWRRVG